MRGPTSLLPSAASLPLLWLLMQAVPTASGQGIIRIANRKANGDNVDFRATGFEGNAQFLKYRMTEDQQFELIKAANLDKNGNNMAMKLEGVTPGRGDFWAGLGKGAAANCHFEIKDGANTSKPVPIEMEVYDNNYLSTCDYYDWVKVVCETTGFTPNCKGWKTYYDEVHSNN